MILMGIGDEAGSALDTQISASRALDWKFIEMRGVEVPGFAKANFHDIPDAAFDLAAGKLNEAGLQVYCFGSAIMNWAKKVADPFEVTLAEVKRCIPRMHRVGAKYVRIMSFKPGDEEERTPAEVFHRVREVTKMFRDAGIQAVHENCMNYGGMSARHAAELLNEVPDLLWVFDTANPAFNADRAKTKPWPRQDPWEIWEQVRERTAHIHIKDATWNTSKNDAIYNWPGEGEGKVRAILADAWKRGYRAGVSIEPHMVVVFHDASSRANDEATKANFVEYGARLGRMIDEIKAEAAK